MSSDRGYGTKKRRRAKYGVAMWEARHYANLEAWDGIDGAQRRVDELHAMYPERSLWTRIVCRVAGHDFREAPLFHYICGRCGFDRQHDRRLSPSKEANVGEDKKQ